MPPRWLRLAIVAFWLSTTGWLVYTDLWPFLLAGQPPPFTVDLIDEVQSRRPATLWVVRQNDRKVFHGRTHIEHPSSDAFDLIAEFHTQPGYERAIVSGVAVSKMKSRYRVTPEGNLLALTVEIEGAPDLPLFGQQFKTDFKLLINGEVQDGVFRPRLEIPGLLPKPFDLPAVEVARSGAVLLPLHPLHRMRGLSPGQRWTLPVLDPLADSVGNLQGRAGGTRTLAAHVRQERELFDLEKREDVVCLVVDYKGDDMNLSLWVDERTGQVLRQESTIGNQHWVMDRD